MSRSFPLPMLLSHALVAFTIEFDNEAERRLPHTTTRHGVKNAAGARHAPWLVSMAMYLNCMQFLNEDEQGISVRDLVKRARATTNFPGMHRWGYISIRPPAASGAKVPKAAWIVRSTARGREAQQIWLLLLSEIEGRWRKRFGEDEIGQLRKSLAAIERKIELDLPDCLPILGHGLSPKVRSYRPRSPKSSDDADLPLAVLLSRVLLALALDFENESELSIAMSANVVRVLDTKGVRLRDLPRLSGVSKEAIAMGLGFLTKNGYAVVESEMPGSRGRTKIAFLTPKGLKAQKAYDPLLDAIEKRWHARFGEEAIKDLRSSLEPLISESGTGESTIDEPTTGEAVLQQTPLSRGLEPYPNGWRASAPKPETLPYYPMVLHRGGFPDGS
jgi:DNA-binding MarR family transcriptional regulator